MLISNKMLKPKDYHIEGIKTNIPMLQEVIAHPAFHSGDTTTDFVNKYLNTKKAKKVK